jgi:hypothetical protein
MEKPETTMEHETESLKEENSNCNKGKKAKD